MAGGAGRIIATLAGGEFRFLSLAAASENLFEGIPNGEAAIRKHALPVSHTYMTAAAMITAAIAAATAINHSRASRGMPACAIATSRFTRCLSNFTMTISLANRVNFRSIRRTGGQ